MLSTPDIIDSHPDLKTLIDFQHFGGEKAFHGRVKTVRCFEDNSFVKKVLSNPSDSEVLIVDGGRSRHCALLGDLLAQMAKNNGWSGIIINGYVRDIEILRNIEIGVMAMGSCPRKSEKKDQGDKDVEISINDITINPGNWCYADENGVLISERELKI